MFCKTSPQLSLFDVNTVFPNALPKEDWCHRYRDQIYPLIDEDIFKELYPGEYGRPNRSVDKESGIHPHFYGHGKAYVAWRRVSTSKET